MDKFKIVEIAIDMAADDGVEYDDLSPGRQMSYYKKAYEDYLDRLADRADMMRKGEAGGGFMRKGFAVGTDEDDIDIPELEEMPNEEFLDLLKQIGAPQPGQESGIRSLKNKQMASAPDPMDTRNDMMQNIAIEYFGKPLKDLTEDEIIQIEEMMDEMTKKQTSSRVMAQEGGIMDLETGRQMYFLGKLVKKATRAVKKIAKSPLGKAAILGGAAYFAGQGGGLGALLKKAAVGAPTDLVTGKRAFSGLFGTGGEFNLKAGLLGQNPFLTFGGLAAILPFLTEEEQQQLISSRGVSIDPGYIRGNPMTFASQVGSGSGTAFALAADGGRIGLKDGISLESILEGKIPPMPMPDPLQKILEKMTPEEKEMFKMRMEIMRRGFEINPPKNPGIPEL